MESRYKRPNDSWLRTAQDQWSDWPDRDSDSSQDKPASPSVGYKARRKIRVNDSDHGMSRGDQGERECYCLTSPLVSSER